MSYYIVNTFKVSDPNSGKDSDYKPIEWQGLLTEQMKKMNHMELAVLCGKYGSTDDQMHGLIEQQCKIIGVPFHNNTMVYIQAVQI